MFFLSLVKQTLEAAVEMPQKVPGPFCEGLFPCTANNDF